MGMAPEQLLTTLIWGFIAAGAFAVLFNVPVRSLLLASLAGALGLLVRDLVLHQGGDLPLSTFSGALAIGIWSAFWSHRISVPVQVMSIPAMIPMIPGVLAYRTMMGLLNFSSVPVAERAAVLAETTVFGLQAIMTLLGIAFGIAIPTIIDRVYLEKFKYPRKARPGAR